VELNHGLQHRDRIEKEAEKLLAEKWVKTWLRKARIFFGQALPGYVANVGAVKEESISAQDMKEKFGLPLNASGTFVTKPLLQWLCKRSGFEVVYLEY